MMSIAETKSNFVSHRLHPSALVFISLHLRSMWETICDAVASWSGWKFGSKFWMPHSQNRDPPSPPPKIEI